MAISRPLRFIAFVMSTAAIVTLAAQQPPRDPAPHHDPSVPRSGTGSISGQVVLSSGAPVSEAQVTISSARGRSTTSTGTDGRFEFSMLPADAYNLYANRQDLLSVRYGERIYNRGGRTIPLAEGEHREFHLTLPRRSNIAGVVTDTSGRPLGNATVRLVRLMPVALYGYAAAFPWGSTTTDGVGAYRLASLDPGDYAVCASTNDTLASDPGVGYAVACTPGTADSPERISIAPEDTRLGVNLTLGTVRFRRVEGVLKVPQEVPRPDLVLLKNMNELYDDPSLAVRPAADGGFRFAHVPPGRYVLRAWAGPVENRAGVLRELTVDDADITDIALTMVSGSTVAGHLAFHGTVLPSAGAHQPRLLLSSPVPGSRNLRWDSYRATPDATGAFVFPSVQPGIYKLSADYLQPQNWYMESVAVPARPDHLIEVRAGENVANVVLNMTDYRAEVTGRIVTEGGVPAPECLIVVYSANPKEWDSPASVGRAHLDGTFSFKLRRPGTYRIGFIFDYDPAVRIGPDVLREVDRKAVTISVADGQKKTASLVVTGIR
jgi:carboxypeptidase family protein